MKLFLTILANLIFVSSFWVLKYFILDAFGDKNAPGYMDAVILFTQLRYSGYAIYGIVCFLSSMIDSANETEKYKLRVKYWQDIGIGICLSDIIDRFKFDISKFTKEDITMLALTFVISYILVYYGHYISEYFKSKFNLYFPNTNQKIKTWLKKT